MEALHCKVYKRLQFGCVNGKLIHKWVAYTLEQMPGFIQLDPSTSYVANQLSVG